MLNVFKENLLNLSKLEVKLHRNVIISLKHLNVRDSYKHISQECNQGWKFAPRFSEKMARFLQKNEHMSNSLKKQTSDLLILSFLVSDLSNLLILSFLESHLSESLTVANF